MDSTSAVVFVVDDDAETCRALCRLLSPRYTVRAFCSPTDFLAAHDPDAHGCLLLDLVMPVLDGLGVQAALAASRCLRPIVFLSGKCSIPQCVRALRAGAVDLLTKPVAPAQLFAAVDEALRLDETRRTASSLRQSVEARFRTLTPRERQVLEGVIGGRLNKQIAADLGTVEKTIKVHRSRVMQKMRVRSVAELVRLVGCLEEGNAVSAAACRAMRFERTVARRWMVEAARNV